MTSSSHDGRGGIEMFGVRYWVAGIHECAHVSPGVLAPCPIAATGAASGRPGRDAKPLCHQ
jgi:hypothetical protein